MNKKGFTMVEIIVSVSLVSIVLISLLSTLIHLRDKYSNVNDDSDVRILGSSISRIINNDIKDNCGLTNITCESDVCTLTLKNGKTRELSLRETEETKTMDITLQSEQDKDATAVKITRRTTIEYKDKDENEKLMTKTLTSITDKITSSSGTEQHTEYHHITGFSVDSKSYSTRLGEQTMYTLTINISDKTYDINIYGVN